MSLSKPLHAALAQTFLIKSHFKPLKHIRFVKQHSPNTKASSLIKALFKLPGLVFYRISSTVNYKDIKFYF